jgi:hypothetical protein|tara:strand:+ start:349 stop:498 length:150 start_codon:yes stop_codon:yes gene_type:complete
MELIVHLSQPFTGNVGVNFSSADTRMTQQFLNNAQVSTVLKQMRGKAMA